MHRISPKFLLAPLLTVLCTFASGSLRAQQTSNPNPLMPPLSASKPLPLLPEFASVPEFVTSASVYTTAPSNSFSADTTDAAPVDQQTAPTSDVQAPKPQTTTGTPEESKRVLGIIPNFRAVGTNAKLPPQTAKQKFVSASQDSFDYSSTVIPALLALYGWENNSVPQFGTGAVAFGRYLWHTTVDQTTENYLVEFIVPVATHEDTRYYTLGHGGFFKRTGYALSRTVITRSDAGKKTFNISEIVGAGASAGMSNLYYPAAQRTFSNTANNWSLDVGLDASTFVLREFWPDINQRLFHKK